MITLDLAGVLYLAVAIIVPFFLPGFAWSFVFLGSKNVWSLERALISFGLSITLVPLTLILLNLFFGVGVTLLNVSLIIGALIALGGATWVIRERVRRRSQGDE